MRKEEELKLMRPQVLTQKNTFNDVETFQNDVLRPILKFQHDIIIHLTKREPLFLRQINNSSTILQKRDIVKRFFLSQPNFKYFLIGQICGLMTSCEFEYYLSTKKDLDKRLTNMLTERIFNHYC